MPWLLNILAWIEAALERFPRLAVQQAAAEGCLALCEAQALAGGGPSRGGGGRALWLPCSFGLKASWGVMEYVAATATVT